MRMMTVAVVAAGLAAAGVALAGEPAAAPMSKAPAAKQAYGKPFTVSTPATPIAEVLANPEKFEGKTVKLSGTVSQVCQAKGCWFEVAPTAGGRGARIKSVDYSIFVPKDCAGRTAVVEGTFKSTTLSEAQAKHLADDAAKAGGKAADVKGPVKEFQVAATAVELN